MSSRVDFDAWQLVFPVIGFALFAGLFIWLFIRAVRMKKPSLDHLENLPLEEETKRSHSHAQAE